MSDIVTEPVRTAEYVLDDVLKEYMKATTKHPGWPKDDFRALGVVAEEHGESWKALLHAYYEGGPPSDVYEEVIQTTVTCIRFLMNYKIEAKK